jgi:hypothetical protein
MFDALALELKELAAADLAALADGELSESLVVLARLRTQLEAIEARTTDEWDRRRCWATDGAHNGTAWLAHRTREPEADCRRRLRLGRGLRHVPVAAEAFAAGDISAAHVRRLLGARNDRTAEAIARDEAMLVERAQSLHYRSFDRLVAYWSLHEDPDGADAEAIDRRDRRRVTLAETFGGMRSGSILLDPVGGEIVEREFKRLTRQLFDADWNEAKVRLGRDPHVGELSRTSDQRRADALVEMARRSGVAPADGKTPKPLFTLVLGSEQFGRLCELGSGTAVAPAAIRPWLSDADLERILFGEAGSRVIDVSYKRRFEGALRRLIEVRDGTCYHPTCDAPAEQCEIDHIEPWGWGGATEQRNGRPACAFHNRLRNQRRGPPKPP